MGHEDLTGSLTGQWRRLTSAYLSPPFLGDIELFSILGTEALLYIVIEALCGVTYAALIVVVQRLFDVPVVRRFLPPSWSQSAVARNFLVLLFFAFFAVTNEASVPTFAFGCAPPG